jgi:hypothetical protein
VRSISIDVGCKRPEPVEGRPARFDKLRVLPSGINQKGLKPEAIWLGGEI